MPPQFGIAFRAPRPAIGNPHFAFTVNRELAAPGWQNIPGIVDSSKIMEYAIGNVSLSQLRELFWQAFDVFCRVHTIHFYWMYGLYPLNFRFIAACEELAGMKPDDPLHVWLTEGAVTCRTEVILLSLGRG